MSYIETGRVEESDAVPSGGGWSLSDEDYDVRPVPAGCAGCWKTGDRGRGPKCITCPGLVAVKRPASEPARERRAA